MNRRARIYKLTACVFIAGMIGVHSPSPLAQAPRVQAGANDDLRAVYANSADVAEGKRVAETTCAACHGTNGVSSIKGIPNLAAQRPGYLYLELKAYQSGARGDPAMGAVVKPLSDDALIKLAAYYASLDPAQPAALSGAKTASATPDPVQAGKVAAAVCAGCHGNAGISKTPGTPNLAGLDPKYLVAAMKAYKEWPAQERSHEVDALGSRRRRPQ